MKKVDNLNERETAVLQAVVDEITRCTGGQFGFTDTVKADGFTDNQIKGYLSQLSQKNYIWIDRQGTGMVQLTEKGNDTAEVDFETV